ncbi:hypothetical protein AbraIFM66951_002012 [Aspergillus brasiliensis]|uniref:Uncharacterized protein n=1 Tax=Aspergillus brasiliensis TaxID=319629 RepID=A0A9W6DQ30_9EURO|nr:hypothetical protein AbraCBS73388_011768 [Aspergillus brasiliensis]GKZ49448.1 hypothetical protein AbraIFM66951_002012 [Aspergillus brasiliensis]
MKLLTCLILGIYATALATDPNAEAECGSLGVMKLDPADLPEGVTPADVRKCADHPLGYLPHPGAAAGGVFQRFLPG